MPSRRNRQGPFYDTATMKALERVPLPDKIMCGRCNKFKNQQSFSNKQLCDARVIIMRQGPQARYTINCGPCSGPQVVEIECTVCKKHKGLEDFAKSQRNKPDEAECFTCVDERLGLNPVNEGLYTGEDRTKAIVPADEDVATLWPTAFDSSTATDFSEAEWNDSQEADDGGYKLSENFARGMAIGSDQETLIETEYEHGSQPYGENDWQTVPTKSWHTKSAKTPSTSSGFNPNKYGKPSTGPSSGSVSGSVHTFSSGYAERDTTSSKNGWARIKAYDPRQDPANRQAEQKPEPVEEEDWSDDDDDHKAQAVDDDSDEEDFVI